MMLEDVKREILDRENILGEYATKTREAIRLKSIEEDIRPAFFHDTDRIIHSNSYSRYNDKTQVFSYSENDNVSRRMVHVQLVSKVARTIGKCLNLNEDLLEAIALGHDIGHAPLGHTGEKILDVISRRDLNIPFMHNLQSVRTFMCLTNNGEGSNLTIQVLDGIMCHNGEILEGEYAPVKKTKDEFLKNYELSCLDKEYSVKVKPMTLEGCVVRVSDVIAYLGRDIEDAISMGILDSNLNELYDLLEQPRSANLNNTNIIGDLIADLCLNSSANEGLKFSTATFEKIKRLKQFNYKYIYKHKCMNPSERYFSLVLNEIFNTLNECYDGMNTLEKLNSIKPFYTKVIDTFIKWISCYWNIETDRTHLKNKILYDMNNIKDYQTAIITYISGMTDSYAIETYNDVVKY